MKTITAFLFEAGSCILFSRKSKYALQHKGGARFIHRPLECNDEPLSFRGIPIPKLLNILQLDVDGFYLQSTFGS